MCLCMLVSACVGRIEWDELCETEVIAEKRYIYMCVCVCACMYATCNAHTNAYTDMGKNCEDSKVFYICKL